MAKATPGIRTRHSRDCRTKSGGACNCTPTYEAWVFDPRADKLQHQGTCTSRSGTDCDCKPKRGAKIRRSFPTLAAAKGWRTDAGSAVRNGKMRAPLPETLQHAAEAWLEACERGEVLSRKRRPYKPSTLRDYRAALRDHVYPHFGTAKLAAVTADDLQRLVDNLVGSGLSGQRVRNIVTPLQALYRRHRRQVLVDPTHDLDLPEPGRAREWHGSPAYVAELLAAVPDDDRATWALAFYGGLRLGELRALPVANVGEASIRIEDGWDPYAGRIDPKSAAGTRDVPLPATLQAIVGEHVERTRRVGSDLLLGREARAPFTPTHVQDRADKAWAAAGLERVSFHLGRHFYKSVLDAAGISEVRADRYAGHSNPSVANRYRHLLPGQLAADAAQLDAYLVGAAMGNVISITGAQGGAQYARTA